MAGEHLYPAEVEVRLWKALEDTRVGMLGLAGEFPARLQPMTAYCEPGDKLIWFFTTRSCHLAQAIGEGAPGVFSLVADDHEVHACLNGDLALRRDTDVIERYWSAAVAAWYPKGKDDPDLALIAFRPAEAEVWVSRKGPVKFGWEVAKANLTGRRPDWGQHEHLHMQ